LEATLSYHSENLSQKQNKSTVSVCYGAGLLLSPHTTGQVSNPGQSLSFIKQNMWNKVPPFSP
jgi:hypothetical protein